jgi:hypothetical protein
MRIVFQFSTGLSRIETYREMLITQTEVLTLEPLVDIRKQLDELKVERLNS